MFLGFRILLFSQHTQNFPIASLFKFHVLFFFVSNLNSLSFSSLPKATPFQHIADEGMSLKPGFRAVTTLCNFNISPTKAREAPVDPD
jgi:hypothetical protein